MQNFRPMTIAARVTEEHAELIKKAARQQNLTINDYMRRIIVPWAASDLGLPAPDLSLYENRDLVADAAALEGLSVREFVARSATEAAMKKLSNRPPPETLVERRRQAASSQAASSQSGLRKAVRSASG